MQRGDDPDDIYNLRARKGNRVTVTIEPEPSPTHRNRRRDRVAARNGERLEDRDAADGDIDDRYRVTRAPLVHGDTKRHVADRGARPRRLDSLPAVVGRRAEQLVGGDVAQVARGRADHHGVRGHVAGDHRARANERLLADLDAGQQHRAAADACAAPDQRAAHQGLALLGATHEVVVRHDDARGR